MKKSLRITIIIFSGLLLAGVTFMLNKAYLAKHTEFISVAVATETILPYEQIKNYHLAKKVKSSVPEDAVIDIEYLKEKDWFASSLGFGEGDIIRKSRLSEAENTPFGPAIALAKNSVLVGVKTNQVLSAGKSLRPGVVAHGFVFIPSKDRDKPDEVKGPDQDPLLADLLIKEVQNSDAVTPGDKGREALPVVVIIETTLPVARQLVYYQEIGNLYLAPKGVDQQAVRHGTAATNNQAVSTLPTEDSAAKSVVTDKEPKPLPQRETRSR